MIDGAAAFLGLLYGAGWLELLPPWASHLAIGVLIVALMGFAAFALVRAGLSPLWALALLIPTVSLIALWVVAYIRWPRLDPPRPADAHDR
jgi:hypothetical protein